MERSVDRCRTCSLGSDALGAWSDLASLVASGGSGGKSPFDGLADKLGAWGTSIVPTHPDQMQLSW